MVHISAIYASELGRHDKGYALWHPEVDSRGETCIGDVGFLDQGKFIKLFNVTDHLEASKRPDGFTPLEIVPQLFDDRQEVIQGPIFSQSASATALGGNVQGELPAVAGAGVSYEWEVSQSRGALLVLKSPAVQHGLLSNQIVPKYIKSHYESWRRYASDKIGFSKKIDLILVRGMIKTDRWMVAAYNAGAASHKGNVKATFLSAGEVGFNLDISNEHRSSIEYRCGPPDNSQTRLHLTHSSGTDASASTTVPYAPGRLNQCIFLQLYKVRYKLWVIPQIHARAGHHELPENHDDDNDDGPTVVTDTETDDAPLETPLDGMLDYILSQANVEVAIACEDDISGLFIDTPWPTDLRGWLNQHRPRVEIEDGLGMMSIEDAVNKRRLHDIRRIARTWQEGAMDVANDDLSRPPNPNVEDDLIIGDGRVVLGRRLPDGPELRWFHLNLYDKEAEGGSVSSISLAPNGVHLVTGSDDSYVRLWNVKTGEMLHKWEGHEDTVWSVMYSPDGSRVVTGSADTKVIVWDPTAEQDALLQELEEHTADVWTVVYSPSGGKFASGSVDCTVKIWDATSYTVLHTLPGHSANVMNVGWTPDERRVISCADSIGRIWSVDTGELIHTLNGHTASIWSMSISHAGDRVITGSEDSTSRIWSTETGDELVTIHEHTGPIWAVAFSPDDTEVASGSYDCSVVTNDSYSGAARKVFSERSSIVDSLVYSTDGKRIFSGAADGHVRIWDRENGGMIAELQGHKDKVKNLVFSEGDKELYSASDDGCVRVWSLQDLARVL